MDSTHWERLERVFLAALEQEPAEMAAFLHHATDGDESFRREIEAMLAAHGRSDGLRIESMLCDAVSDPPVERVGAFRIVERIGSGGMGDVFRAERADGQFEQTVAVKLIRSGIATHDLTRRFRAERQILARLEHPNIARLLDGGVTEHGLPYLVMEYVRGRSITSHCDAMDLSVDERLVLFGAVCRVVQYAHQNLVVHRDLKPSNILVSESGDVKLLDFGVAKLLESDETDPGVTARTVLERMTPEYASPEQVRGDAITTATDVYSLGLLLYELLVGRRAQERVSSLLEMERTICETAVAPPSTVVAAAMRRRLRGDLDLIVGTALQKSPARRYATAELFAADIDRHLRGLPIVARPDTFHYRATKFLRRHRVAVGAAAAVAVSLVAGLVLAVAGMVRAGRAERAAVAEAAASGRISEFLVDLFRHSDPGTARGEEFTARQLLERGAAQIDSLAGQPEVQARLLATMAEAYNGLGLFDQSLSLFERELEVQRATFGEGSVEVARALTHVSSVHAKRGDFAMARDVASEALAILETTVPEDSPDVSRALNQLAIAHGQLGENAEARAILERSAAILERLHGPESIQMASPLTNLAIVHWQEGHIPEARALYERVLHIQERKYGTDDVTIAHTLNNWALACNADGEYEKGRGLHERALAIRERLLEGDHPDIGESLNNLGSTLLALREYERARDVLERALVIREKALGPGHVYVATTLANLGTANYNLGDAAAARPLLERSLVLFERALGPKHPMVAYPLLVLAQIETDENRLDEAESKFRRALLIRSERLGDSHPDVAEAREKLAAFLQGTGRPDVDSAREGGGSD